ncbi:MAG: glycoside hydrolase family 99-like domain-containing protein [Gammaproteobacteria bacterium]
MSPDDTRPGDLPWTGERYVPKIDGDIEMEHLHRYAIARDLAYGKDVLDIACGEGYGSELLATVARKVTGVDISEETVAHAARKYVRPNIAFAVGSCACIPLADANVDLVVSFETIEHHDRHLEMMQEIRRVLRPAGVLIISSPDKHEYSDVPNYKNEYHVKELYLSEFRDLLAAGFKHVRMLGQRVNFGSLVAPTDGRATRFATYSRRNESVRREPGVMKPVYYIALASNAALPQIHGGLYDGTSYLSSQLAGRDGQIASLTQAVADRDGRITSLNEAVAKRERLVAEHERLIAEREREIAGLNQAVADRDAHIASLNETVAGRNGRIAHLERKVDKRDAKITRLERAMTQRDGKVARLIQAVAAREAKLNAMRSSTSWRVTAPLRAVRAALAKMRLRYRARVLASRTARFVYRRLPLSVPRRLMLKHFVFSALSRFVRHTGAYKAWVARTEPARTAAGQPALSPKTSMPVVGNTEPGPVPGRPGSAQIADLSAAISEFLFAESSSEHVPITQTPGIHTAVKVIAFYLPQFHPIPENDAWWGKGFTEWTNVTRARPQFLGHHQPHLPGELGFYDLRLLDVQQRQIELARAYGIYGFCYHHYWFGGRRLLDRPFNEVLANKQLDLPFCLCWANENWSRRWDGHDQEILISQHHSPEDDMAFIKDIEPALRDPRYIRVDGRPLLIVYRVSLLPDARATAQRWRDYCQAAGIGDLLLVAAQSFAVTDPRPYGFDAAVQFPPHNVYLPTINHDMAILNAAYSGSIFDYREIARAYAEMEADGYPMFRAVMPGWDNEARRPGRGHTFFYSTPDAYADWLDKVCASTVLSAPSQRLVFVNAWNEWGEGAHLEPDRKYGYAYLQATRDVLSRYTDGTVELVVAHAGMPAGWTAKLAPGGAVVDLATPPVVSIVIPVHGRIELTRRCLAALEAAPTALAYELIIVDDASPDGSGPELQRLSGVRVIALTENVGFVHACNRGAAEARGRYLVFLNNDTEVQPAWLDALHQTFADHPRAGLVGARLIHPDGTLQEAGSLIFRDASAMNFGRGDDPERPEYNVVRDVDYCSGACVMLPTELFRQLGGFDPRYAPAYYEDGDLAFRVREAGLRVLYQPACRVRHLEGGTAGTDLRVGAKRYQAINQVTFLKRWQATLASYPSRPTDEQTVDPDRHGGLRVLVVDHITPRRDLDSASVRMDGLLRLFLARGFQVTFAADNLERAGRDTERLQRLGVEVLYAPQVPSLEAHLAQHGARYRMVVLSRRDPAARHLPAVRRHAPQATLVFDTVDLHFIREEREATLAEDVAARARAARGREDELALARAADLTVVVSPVERELLRAHGISNVSVIGNLHEVAGRPLPFGERRDLLFVGFFLHRPNADAMAWFGREIWPQLAQRLPDARLRVVGRDPPAEVRALAGPRVDIAGQVPDLEPLVAASRVMLAPLRYGAGVKGKISLSLSRGLPVVATSVAVEGMGLEDGAEVLIADGAAAFADAVVRLYEDPALWTRLSDCGLQHARRHLSVEAAARALDTLLAQAGLAPRPLEATR